MTPNEPRKYRKKPVVVEAVRFLGYYNHFPDWAHKAITTAIASRDGVSESRCFIRTLEGELLCSYGDWLIRGVKGEVYPCKNDIFEATYEPADD